MLAYQPAFDPFHTIFRLLRLGHVLRECSNIEKDKLRILDFYTAFPFLASDMSFKKGHTGLRKIAKQYDFLRPYGSLPDSSDLFMRMAPIQKMAIETLISRGFLDPSAYSQGIILFKDFDIPDHLTSRIANINAEQASLIALLQTLCGEYPLFGSDGLKHRTGLMEYRYDAI